jgi:hypothetical protein
MARVLIFIFSITALISCSKNKEASTIPPEVIPANLFGSVYDFNMTPLDITTPDKGFFSLIMNGTLYKVVFNAVDEAAANATIRFASDSILMADSREYASLGRDVISYWPVAENEIEVFFKDGRKINGYFDENTKFGGTFGEQVIAQWRDPADPAKPNQKARSDIRNLVRRYADKDGPGPENAPVYLSVTVSKP